MNERFRAIALCALGLEKVLSNEIERVGLDAKSRSPGRVYFEADALGLFRANLELRTAERILLEAARFHASDFDALFEGARGPAWQRFFARDDRLVIERVRSRDSVLTAQTSIQSIVHKAIYEMLGRHYHVVRLSETGRERSLRVYLENDECVIGLDLSGEALHRRGYRRASGEAPLKETIAAGILFLAGYRRRLPLLDPFCGAGTLLIEAALFALDRAPGLDRHFELESMPIAREGADRSFVTERERASAAVRRDLEPLLVGRDVDPAAIEMARANARNAGVGPLLRLEVGRAEDLRPGAEAGILLSNPPYGERLGTEAESEALYRKLGESYGAAPDSADCRFAGWSLGFVTNRPDFGDFFGRRAPVEKELLNGAEDQWFHWYPAGWETRPLRARNERARGDKKETWRPRAKEPQRGGHRPYVPNPPEDRPRVDRPRSEPPYAPGTSVGPRRGDSRTSGNRPAVRARDDRQGAPKFRGDRQESRPRQGIPPHDRGPSSATVVPRRAAGRRGSFPISRGNEGDRRPTGNRPTGNRTLGNRTTDNRTTDNRTTDNRTTDNRTTRNRPAGYKFHGRPGKDGGDRR